MRFRINDAIMDKNRFPAKIARAVAEKLTAELIPTAERIEIAGSLRRNKEFVHDIDVVVLPSADGNAFETALRVWCSVAA